MDKALHDSHFHKTYLHPKFVPGNAGDTEGLLKRVDEVPRMNYGLAIVSFDPTPYEDLSNFSKAKGRRKRRVQMEGRSFTAIIEKACVALSIVSPFDLNRRCTRTQR